MNSGDNYLDAHRPFLEQLNFDGLSAVTQSMLADLVIDLNAELAEREERNEPFDYKRELKSPVAVRKLTSEVIGMYQKGVRRGKSVSFSGEVTAALSAAGGSQGQAGPG